MEIGVFLKSDFPRQPVPPPDQAAEWLRRAAGKTILVVGDYFLDRYWEIDRRLAEDSIETGLEAHQVVGRRLSPGAAGTVTNNLTALGCRHVLAVGFTGRDGEGWELLRALRARGVDTGWMLESDEVMTPTYTKPMLSEDGSGFRELSRLDIQNRRPLGEGLRSELSARLRDAWAHADGVLVADQVEREGCGVWDERMRAALAELARNDPDKPVLIDSRANIAAFSGVMLKPNEVEAADLLGLPALRADTGVWTDALIRRHRSLSDRPWFITLGACGMVVCVPAAAPVWLRGIEVPDPIDIVGAGDSTAAGIMMGLVGGATPADAGWIGQATASLTVQQLGTTGTATAGEVVARLGTVFDDRVGEAGSRD